MWVGASFGGRLVAEVAARFPAAVERAVLLDPALQLSTQLCLERAESERLERRFRSVEEAIQERLDSGLFFSTPDATLEEEMREHLVPDANGGFTYRYCRSAAVAAWGEMGNAAPPVAQVPTQLVLGGASWIDNRAQVRRYRRAVAQTLEVTTVPGGHNVLWDAFEQTAGAIGRFLGAPAAASPLGLSMISR